MKTNYYYQSLLLWLLAMGSLSAQLSWNTTGTSAVRLSTCYQQETFQVSVTNVSGNPLTRNRLTIELPPGVHYLPGNVNQTGCGIAISDFDVSNTNRPVFSVENMATSGANTLCFRFAVRADCQALNHILSGGDLENRYLFVSDGTAFPAHTTSSYTLDYPALDFLSVTNAAYIGNLGDVYTQTVRVSNGGSSPSTNFYLALNPPAGLAFSNPSIGTLNATGDTLFFSGADLGPDQVFSPNEIIEFSYDVEMISCSGLSTVLDLNWTCEGQACVSPSTSNINATANNFVPNIVSTVVQNTVAQCLGQPDQQSVRLENTGAGVAENVEFMIQSTVPGFTLQFGYFLDTSTIEISVNGGAFVRAYASSAVSSNSSHYSQCPTNMRVGRAFLDFADMQPGDSYVLRWQMTTCCPPPTCGSNSGGFRTQSWSTEATYQSNCGLQYTTGVRNGTGSYRIAFAGRSASAFGPANVADGAVGTFGMIYTPSIALGSAATGRTIEFITILPPGLDYVAGSGLIYNRNFDIACPWNPISLTQSNDTVYAVFNWDGRPACFGATTNMEFQIELRGNCAAPGFVPGTPLTPRGHIEYTFNNTNPACTNGCNRFVEKCLNYPPVQVQCPTICVDGGIFTREFYSQRLNLGLPDNNNNGVYDGVADGPLDLNAIRANTVIQGDTLRTVFRGDVNVTGVNFQWAQAYAQSQFVGPRAAGFSPIVADVTVYDVSSGDVYTGTVTPAALGANSYRTDINAVVPAGFVYEQDDSIVVVVDYLYNNNGSSAIQAHQIVNEFYTSQVINPSAAQRFACNQFNGDVTTIGWYYTASGGTVTRDNCNTFTISREVYLSIGPCCANYNGGNYFRNEIRHFSFPRQLDIPVPTGYEYVGPTRFRFIRSPSVVSGFFTLTETNPGAATLNFPINQLFEPYGGPLILSDEGFRGTVQTSFRPTCAAPPSISSSMRMFFESAQGASPAFEAISRTLATTYQYTRPNLEINPINIFASVSDTMFWDFRVTNTSNDATAPNAFVAFTSLGNLGAFEVIDLATNTPVPISNGIYELGTVGSASTRDFRVAATANCLPDTLIGLVGWNCGGYPSDLASYSCELDSAFFQMSDPAVELQFALRALSDSSDMCTPTVYEMEFTSARAAGLTNLQGQITLPLGLSPVPGSVQYEYPLGSPLQAGADPVLVGSNYVYNISAYSPDLEVLPGLSDAAGPEERRVRVRFALQSDCDFISGLSFPVSGQAGTPCGTPLPAIAVQTPPLLIRGSDPAPYFMQASPRGDVITACGTNHNFYYEIGMLNLGPVATRLQDELIIRLPVGLSMVSYNPLDPSQRNAPTGQPTVTALPSGETQLSWPNPGGVVSGDSIVWRIAVEAENTAAVCAGPNIIQALSLVNSSVLCVADGTICPSQASNGNANYNIVVNRPSLDAQIISTASNNYYDPISGNNFLSLGTEVSNTGSAVLPGDDIIVEYFCDGDNSGTLTPGDQLIGSYRLTGAPAAGASEFFYYQDTFAVGLCDLNNGANMIAIIRDTTANLEVQCACEYSERAMPPIILPQYLLHFSAKASGCEHLLSWALTAQQAYQKIVLEQSPNGIDFRAIADFESADLSYEYSFAPSQKGEQYYRLALYKASGQIDYSPVQHLLSTCEGEQALQLFPNPASGEVFLRYQGSESELEQVELQVFDAYARRVWQQNLSNYTVGSSISLNLGELSEGFYIVEWRTAQGKVLRESLIIKAK